MNDRKHSTRLIGVAICLVMLYIPATALAQSISDIPAAFADIGYGARPMGMGGAFVALADDANALLWNPAGLAALERTQLTGMWARQMGLIPHGFIGFAQPVSPRNSLGAGAISSGDAALHETTALLSVAHRLSPDLSLGLSFKARMATYGNNAEGVWDPGGGNRQVQGRGLGFALDVGLLYALTDQTSLGLMWRDAFAPVDWSASNETGTARGGGESIPMALIFGTAHRLSDDITLSLVLDRALHADGADRICLGYENRLWDLLHLRAGYGQQITASPEQLYTLGLGLENDFGTSWNMAFDFAYLFHELANTPRMSMTVGF